MRRIALLIARNSTLPLIATLAASLTAAGCTAKASEPPPALAPAPAPLAAPPIATSPAVSAKPLSPAVKRGLAFLAARQLADGGFGQGEESMHMGGGGRNTADRSNVADTCVTVLALLRAGSTPQSGPHAQNVLRGVEYVLGQIERADADSLSITDVNGTRVQGKLGTYVDTFMASLMLAEAKGHMPDALREARLGRALDKVLHKIQRNQRADGGFENAGWAPVLAQAVAGKGVNRAVQKGAAVSAESRKRFDGWAERQYDAATGGFEADDSAGIGLYAAAATVGTLEESKKTRSVERAQAKAAIASKRPVSEVESRKAQTDIQEAADVEKAANVAQQSVIARLEDSDFVAGFGSNGGEEFLSYMLLAESLVAKGGKEWQDWDRTMTANLERVQNGDGSWTGHHCITGRNFVTAAAVLVLTADRAQVRLGV